MIVRLDSCLSYPVCKAHAPYYTAICGLSSSTTAFHTFSHKHYWLYSVCVCVSFFFLKFFCETFLVPKEMSEILSWRYIHVDLHVNYTLSCQASINLEFSRLILELKKLRNIKFHEIPSSESRAVHVSGETDVTKLIVALGNFLNAPKTLGGYRPLFVFL